MPNVDDYNAEMREVNGVDKPKDGEMTASEIIAMCREFQQYLISDWVNLGHLRDLCVAWLADDYDDVRLETFKCSHDGAREYLAEEGFLQMHAENFAKTKAELWNVPDDNIWAMIALGEDIKFRLEMSYFLKEHSA